MKKSLSFFIAAFFATVFLASCESTKTAVTSSDQNKSDCQFEFGTNVSAYFTGTAPQRTVGFSRL